MHPCQLDFSPPSDLEITSIVHSKTIRTVHREICRRGTLPPDSPHKYSASVRIREHMMRRLALGPGVERVPDATSLQPSLLREMSSGFQLDIHPLSQSAKPVAITCEIYRGQ